ncbi:PrpF domain-containing protein [Chloroflexota bacterium]
MWVYNSQERIRAWIVRGGTSKAVFFLKGDLPSDYAIRDKIILEVFGSPDARQINGLGAAHKQTSKTAIIGSPTKEGTDVDYTFGQVMIAKPTIDWGGELW